MSDKTSAWDSLDMKTKAWVIQQAVQGGISANLNEIKQLYNQVDSLNNVAIKQNPNIIKRLNQDNIKTIPDWEDPRSNASHKMSSYGNRVIGLVQDINGNLIDFTNPINHKNSNMWDAGIKSAEQNKDYVEFGIPEHAETYGQFYKLAYPQHFMHTKKYDDGGYKNSNNIYNYVTEKYPESEHNNISWLDEYFKTNTHVSGMAIGGGLNGIYGNREVIYNKYSNLSKEEKDAVMYNERLRHLFDEHNLNIGKPTLKQKLKYKNTEYSKDNVNLMRTEAARYLSGDDNRMSKRQIRKLDDFLDTINTNNREFNFGGDTETSETSYNIFEDTAAETARLAHIKSLKNYAKKNPVMYGLNTADFVDFLSQIAGLESSYNSSAFTKSSSYSGYYGLKNGKNFSEDKQHEMAYRHLSKLFKESITDKDLERAKELGISPAQLLAKYWNQGNRVTDYLYNNKDNNDALGTKISNYGWNVTAPVEYSKLLPKAITDRYIEIKDAKSLAEGISRARNDYMNYSDRENHILQLNDSVNPYGFTVKKFDPTKLKKGDKVKLISDENYNKEMLKQQILHNKSIEELLYNPYMEILNGSNN